MPYLDLDLDLISVGFDPRATGTPVLLPAGDTLTVRYQPRSDREPRQPLKVVTDTRAKVAAVLRRHGYSVIDDCGPCCEFVDLPTAKHCGHSGERVTLPCPAGRPDAVGGPYCEEHGGRARAQREAECDWNHLAPASVGDEEDVQDAGCMGLTTRHAYLTIQHEPAGAGRAVDRWLASLGIGSHMVQVANPATRVSWQPGEHAPKGAPRRKRNAYRAYAETKEEWRIRCATVGGYAFLTRESAIAEGTRVWRETLATRVEEIRRARGGTFNWGVEIEPLAEPIIVESASSSSWDVAIALPRRGKPGLAVFSGLRPSGEAL